MNYVDRTTIKKIAEKYYPEVVELRRYFHKNPEISKKEFNTQKKIIDVLGGLNLNVRKAAGTGVIAELKGDRPGKTIAVRADIDALAINDECGKPYQSQNKGACHACGHDGHISMLLGVIKVLCEMRDKIDGTVRFIFQPSEEEVAGGAGADLIVKDGGLKGVDAIIGAHLWQPLKIGTVGVKSGPLMAANDEFTITIKGKGGHASMPHQTVDALLVGAEIVVALNTIISRNVDPIEQGVVSLGIFRAGQVYNAIPGEAIIKGTIRTLNKNVRKQILDHIQKITKYTCEMSGANYKIDEQQGTYVVVNDSEVTKTVVEAGKEVLGDGIIEVKPFMGGEDFSYYLKEVPGCFMFIGVGNPEKGIIYPQHHPKYDIDEKALLYGIEVMSNSVLKLLSK